MKLKTVHSTHETVIDSETGEVLDVSTKKIQIIIDKERFALVYASFWDAVTESNLSKSDIELLGYLINNYGEGTTFTINSLIKETVAKKANKNPTSYNKSSRALIDAGFIIELRPRTYIINPAYAFQGSSANRKKAVLELYQEGILPN